MMEGIEVLATIPEGTNLVVNLPVAIIAGGIIWLVFGIWLATYTDNIFVGLLSGFLIGFVIFAAIIDMSAEYTEFIDIYKVTISDEIKLNEFNERYVIINQEGKIYTIKEREEVTINNSSSSR